MERQLFAAHVPYAAPAVARPRGVGVRIWLAAAVALVIGIVIGFGSGYDAGRRASATIAGMSDLPPDSSATGSTATAQTFSESAVAPPAEPGTSAAATAGEPVPIVEAPVVPVSRPIPEAPRPEPAPRAEAPIRESPVPEPAPPVPSVESRPAAESRSPAAESRPAGPGSIEVVSRPSGAQVVLDGQVIGRTPLILNGVGPGRHAVRLELSGFQRWATSIEVTAGNRTRVAASLEQ